MPSLHSDHHRTLQDQLDSRAFADSTSADLMQAIVQDEYGSDPAAVLRVADVPRPSIGADEVLVRVRATSVDRGTWHVMSGLPYPIRLAGFGLRRPKALNPGRSVSGIVQAVGENVSAFAPGDEVFGICEGGSFAAFAAARADKLARKPALISFEEAAVLPVSGLTALQAVRDKACVTSGEKLLILGASGGVGTFAVQIAKAYGADVTGVCSTAKADLVRSLGADHVIDYTEEDPTNGQIHYDAILDIGGNRRLAQLRRALTRAGRLVIVGGETDGRWLGGSDRQIRATLLSKLVSQKLGTFLTSENAADLTVLAELVDAGKVTPTIDQTYPLRETAAAISHVQDGRARGKIAITV
jgi:NADPH:quinone reductase-like Zn-dependent oxidoreductase